MNARWARLTGGLVVAALGLSLSQALVVAKGPVDRITIEGGGLARPVAVTEGDGLLEFNPWGQKFLGERLATAPGVAAPATVTMFLKNESGELKPVYRFAYYAGAGGGVLYLPGPGDADYRLNSGTILTPDGWFRATPAWDAFVAAASRVQPPSTGDGGLR